jgi:hypothetical protein
MNSVIYRGRIASVPELNKRHIGDGETPAEIFVTEEDNGFLVWSIHPDAGRDMLDHFWNRSEAIEFGVDEARRRRKVILEMKEFV